MTFPRKEIEELVYRLESAVHTNDFQDEEDDIMKTLAIIEETWNEREALAKRITDELARTIMAIEASYERRDCNCPRWPDVLGQQDIERIVVKHLGNAKAEAKIRELAE